MVFLNKISLKQNATVEQRTTSQSGSVIIGRGQFGKVPLFFCLFFVCGFVVVVFIVIVR